jgi:hypothetical protein
MKSCTRFALAMVVAALASLIDPGPAAAQEAAPTPQQRVAALKQSLQKNQANLRRYEWIETTIVSLKGEEKSRKQQRCYYGADGKLQKLPVEGAPESAPQRGRRGGRLKQAIVENKKEDMQEYMERASSLIHHYVPPNPDDVENAKNGGKLAVRPGQSGAVLVEFTDYIKPGDRLAIDVDGASNTLAGLNVASYLDQPDDAVTLNVQFGTLKDGTSYASQTTLDAKAKNVRVVIQNSGHRPIPQ